MTIKECYLYVLDRLNNNTTNSNQEITGHSFIRTMRAATYLWVDQRITNQEVTAKVQQELQRLVVTKKLTGQKKDGFYRFVLPSNFYHRINFRVAATSTVHNCESMLEGVLVESANLASYLNGDDTRPNFEFEQTIVTIEGDHINVYYRDFTVDHLLLTYYRKPVSVNMATGFHDENNIPTVDVNPEFDDSDVYEILNLTALMIAGDTSSPKYQPIGVLAQAK